MLLLCVVFVRLVPVQVSVFLSPLLCFRLVALALQAKLFGGSFTSALLLYLGAFVFNLTGASYCWKVFALPYFPATCRTGRYCTRFPIQGLTWGTRVFGVLLFSCSSLLFAHCAFCSPRCCFYALLRTLVRCCSRPSCCHLWTGRRFFLAGTRTAATPCRST